MNNPPPHPRPTSVPGLTHFSPLKSDSLAPPKRWALARQDDVLYAALLWALPALISNAEQQLRAAAATTAEKERLERVLFMLQVGAGPFWLLHLVVLLMR
jgi:hypothetical protein